MKGIIHFAESRAVESLLASEWVNEVVINGVKIQKHNDGWIVQQVYKSSDEYGPENQGKAIADFLKSAYASANI